MTSQSGPQAGQQILIYREDRNSWREFFANFVLGGLKSCSWDVPDAICRDAALFAADHLMAALNVSDAPIDGCWVVEIGGDIVSIHPIEVAALRKAVEHGGSVRFVSWGERGA